jgi:hypothetical protein
VIQEEIVTSGAVRLTRADGHKERQVVLMRSWRLDGNRLSKVAMVSSQSHRLCILFQPQVAHVSLPDSPHGS